MKRVTKLFLLVITLSFILIVSCSKDNTTSPQITGGMADYQPLSIGTWWKYDEYDVDMLGTRNNKRTGFLTMTGTKIIEGKQAYIITLKMENSDSTKEIEYFTIEDGKLFCYYNIPELAGRYGWIVEADLNSNQWTLEDTLEIKDSTGVHSETHSIWTIKKGGQKDYQINGKTIQSQEFISEQISISNYTINGVEGIDTVISTANNWYGKGVGRVHTISSITFSGKDNPWPTKMETETVLVDYGIK